MASRISGITIEIGGDTTKLEKSLSSVNKELKGTQTSLSDVNKLLKLDPKNTELLAQKQGYLSKAIDETKEKLEAEKKALQQIKDNNATGEVTEDQKALEREIVETETKLKSLTKEYGEFGKSSGANLEAAGKKVKSVGDKMQTVGKGLTTYVTGPIVALGTAAVKTTADFDEQMSKVSAISGATGKDFESLRDKARDMGAKTKFSATEAGQAFEYMAMAGWKTDDMLEGVEGVMNLAAAAGEDLGTTSDIVTDALTAFGMEAKDAGKFANILASASTNANTNVSMLGESFKYVAPVAGAMGYSVEDITTALGLMANAGVKSSSAGTALRNVITRLAKPTKESEAAMERLGITLTDDQGNMKSFREIMDDMRKSFGEINMPVEEFNRRAEELDNQLADGTITEKQYDKALEELTTQAYGAEGAEKARAAAMLAGKTGMSGLLAIVNASEEDYKKLTKAIDNSSQTLVKTKDGAIIPMSEAMEKGIEWTEEYNGSAEQMASVMGDNLNGQVKILMSQLQELAISVGDILMPTIRDIVSWLQGMVDKFNGLDEGTKKAIVKFGLVAAAIGPVVTAAGGLTSGIGTVMGTFGKLSSSIGAAGGIIPALGGVVSAAGPLLAGGAVVAGIVAGGVLIYKNWDKIKEAAGKLADGIKKTWNNIKESTKKAWENIKTSVSKGFEAAKNAVVKTGAGIAKAAKEKFDAVKKSATTAVENMKTGVTKAFEGAKKVMTTTAENISKAVKDKFEALKNGAVTAFDNLKTSVSKTFENVKKTLTTVAGNISDTVKTKFEAAKKSASTAFENLKTSVTKTFENVKKSLTTVAGNIATTVKSKFDEAKKSASTAFENLKNSVTKAFESAKKTLTATAGNIASAVKTKFEEAKRNASAAFEGLKSSVTKALNGAKSALETTAGNIASAIKNKFESAKKGAVSAFDSLKSGVTKAFGGAKSNLASSAGDIYKAIKGKLEDAKTKGASAITGLKSSVERTLSSISTRSAGDVGKSIGDKIAAGVKTAKQAMSGLGTSVKSSLDSVKRSAANFSWKIPRPQLPKIKLKTSSTVVDGKTITYPSGFDVSWYKKAYANAVMFSNPTVLQTPAGMKGFGDGNGSEIVLSDRKLREIAGSGQTTYNINIYGAEGQNVNALADAVQARLAALQRQREAAGLA